MKEAKRKLQIMNIVLAIANILLFCFFVKTLKFHALFANVLVWILGVGFMYIITVRLLFPVEYPNNKEKIKSILRFYFHRLLWLLMEECGLIIFFQARGIVRIILHACFTKVSIKIILVIFIVIFYDKVYGKVYRHFDSLLGYLWKGICSIKKIGKR